ncbi:MAG: hypothetical protein U0641_13950 [Anaerolineae bacterium]
MISFRHRSAWQAFRPHAPPVIYCLCVTAWLLLLSLFAYGMGMQAERRGDVFDSDPSCAATANVAPASGACRTERAAVDNLRLGTARGPTPGFDARLGDGSTVRVDLPHGTNDALLRLAPGDILPVQVWQGTAVRVWIDGQGYATSDNPTQQAGAWLQGAQMGALVLWLPLLAGAWLALRGWILSREPTYE